MGRPVTKQRLHDTIDLLLTMQNPGGGYASYETINGPAMTEWLNPAEVFGRIMVGIRLSGMHDLGRDRTASFPAV